MTITSKKKHAFTLLELMVTFAIVLIISILAYPVLTQFLVESKVTEALNSVTPIQSMVNNQIADSGSVIGSGSSLNTPATISRYVSAYSVSSDGVISLTTTADAGGITLTLTPVYDATSEEVSWSCAVSSSSSDEYVPAECRI